MINGSVTAQREALIKVEVRDSENNSHYLNAVIDTGFNRFFGFPMSMITALGLHKLGWEVTELGDGSVRRLDTYEAVVFWDGAIRSVVVHAADTSPLVGMALLAGYSVFIQVVSGGEVKIEALKRSER